MNCCFLFNPLKQMESSKADLTPSVTEYLEKEKICQEICKTITQSVESTSNANFAMQTSALLPELNSDDDIEGILQQISAILGSQYGENSNCTEFDGNDSLSVEEILKEAENLVRASTPFFERNVNQDNSISQRNGYPSKPPNLRLCQDQGPIFTKEDIPVKQDKEVSSPESQLEDNKTLDGTEVGSEIEDVEEIDDIDEDKTPINENQFNISLEDNELDENKVKIITDEEIRTETSRKNSGVELKLTDLQAPPDSTFVLKMESHSQEHVNDAIEENQDRAPPPIEDSVLELKRHIEMLNAKVALYEKNDIKTQKIESLSSIERQRLKLLQDEVRSQEELIEGYQRENQRLTNDIISAKDAWKDTEEKLLGKVKKLDLQLRHNVNQRKTETDDLRLKLKNAYDLIRKLECEVNKAQEEKSSLNNLNEELTLNITRLNSEIEEYKKEIQLWNRTENEKLAVMENNALIQSKLSQANTEVTRKQTEIIRLNGEIGRLRGELEKIRLGSVVNQNSDSSNTITQLQAALAMERENCRDITLERDNLSKEMLEMQSRIKEMESLMSKKPKPGICLPLSESSSNSAFISLHRKNKAEQEISDFREQLSISKKNLKDLQVKYDRDVYELEQQLKRTQRENTSLKHLVEDQNTKPDRKRLASINSAKEDAHLLATIRGLKLELNGREKDIMRLNKELDDAKKTNKRLQKEREKALNPLTKLRSAPYLKDIEKPSSRASSDVSTTKEYNPVLFEENQETLAFLRNENRSLKEEIKRLEQDLISLHNKRIQDLSDLQEQHEVEIARLVREHATKHSASTVAHLQSQLYTQQMVIHHLKDQVKQMEDQRNEVAMLKSERDHLETTLLEANKKIARLHDLASPENVQYSGLLEKLEFLERRHEVREQKLQAIVRDLVAKQGQAITCGANCRDKLHNKNREICYYRAEMDKILATLAEFRWTQ
ncbi:centrosomal protein of 162 kDa-like [Cimex lectularius]|uniref:Centrosomal protein of 162 kDa n=1 Tax=Cimex lectularius TaxID=79782 RepID=A0A8I6RZD4_CIMLE|nr:centrosomal protein of 162 kDa-like [Cimex lectularius]